MKKRIIPMLLLLMFVLSIPANAADASNVVTPQFVSTESCRAILTFSGTTAQCGASIKAINSTDKITATMTLYRIEGTTKVQLAKWVGLSGTGSLSVAKTWVVTSGYTYELTVSATVVGANGTDYPTASVQATCR